MIDRRERFIALAEKRVTRALRDLRLIGNLANRRNYVYSDGDAQKILSTIEAELKTLRSRFQQESEKKIRDFKL